MSRTLHELDHHLSKIVDCGKKYTSFLDITNEQDIKLIIANHLCKSKYCKTCSRIYLDNLKSRLYQGTKHKQLYLITLTLWTKIYSKKTAYDTINYNFNKFIQNLRRRGYKFEYFKVLELTKIGYPHLHIIVDTDIPTIIVKKVWKQYTTSWQVKNTKSISNYNAIFYLSKYMTKNTTTDFNKFFYLTSKRRYAASKSFLLKIVKTHVFKMLNQAKFSLHICIEDAKSLLCRLYGLSWFEKNVSLVIDSS